MERVRYPGRGKAPQRASDGLTGAWLREVVREAREERPQKKIVRNLIENVRNEARRPAQYGKVYKILDIGIPIIWLLCTFILKKFGKHR